MAPRAIAARTPGADLAGPLRMLDEIVSLPHAGIPEELAAAYGGDLGFEEPRLYANFVASVDGVVALGPEHPSSGSLISGREPADRLVMGLLRAFADAVLIGAGTFRATPDHLWTAEHIYPAGATAFAELRRSRGRPATPELIVTTARGELPLDHPALQEGAVVATTEAGRTRLASRLPDGCEILVCGDGQTIAMPELIPAIRARGHSLLLTEGGPHVVGELLAAGLLDEMFLTVSPLLAGRAGGDRPGLVAGVELLPDVTVRGDLASVRRGGSYLFLRYLLGGSDESSA